MQNFGENEKSSEKRNKEKDAIMRFLHCLNHYGFLKSN